MGSEFLPTFLTIFVRALIVVAVGAGAIFALYLLFYALIGGRNPWAKVPSLLEELDDERDPERQVEIVNQIVEKLASTPRFRHRRLIEALPSRQDYIYNLSKFIKGSKAPTGVLAYAWHMGKEYGSSYYGPFVYNYGLDNPEIAPQQHIHLIYLYGQGLAIWSHSLKRTVGLIAKDSLHFSRGKSNREYLTVDLKGFDTLARRKLNLSIRFMMSKITHRNGYISTDDSTALMEINYLLAYLREHLAADSFPTKRGQNYQSHTHASHDAKDDDVASAGKAGEILVRNLLRELKGRSISGFIPTDNIVFKGRNFELDFLVLSPYLGMVVIEVKHHVGTIAVSGADEWAQIKHNETKIHKNPCKQAVRATELLQRLLRREGIPEVPFQTVVVYSHPEAWLRFANNSPPQTPVLKMDELVKYLAPAGREQVYRFDLQAFESIKSALAKYEMEFQHASNE